MVGLSSWPRCVQSRRARHEEDMGRKPVEQSKEINDAAALVAAALGTVPASPSTTDVAAAASSQLDVTTGERVEEPLSESEEFNQLVETVLREVDLDREYNELEKLLEVGDNRRDYVTIFEALDKAESRALRAHGMWAVAKIELLRVTLNQEAVDAALWTKASDSLEAEKEEGTRKKAITLDDVRARIAQQHPDEWRNSKVRLEKAKVAVERCLHFAALWKDKIRSLQTMLATMKK